MSPWAHLQKMTIPIFDGDKRRFESWWAAFSVCVDAAPVTPELKMLRLRQYLRGEPLRTIDNLGYSSATYASAKELLARKYDGKRQRVAFHVEALEQIGKVGYGKAAELERFVELLEVAVVNLKGNGRAAELGAGTFYQHLTRKLDERILVQFHRWRYERRLNESVEVLLEWARAEADFLIQSSETVHGLFSKPVDGKSRREPSANHRSFHVQTAADTCRACNDAHPLWKCSVFKAMAVTKR